jgi:hypothetical protein
MPQIRGIQDDGAKKLAAGRLAVREPKTRHAGNLGQFRAAGKGHRPAHAITLAPLLARQALGRRSFTPIRPHVRAYHAALGADRLPVQVQEHGVARPAVCVDNCAVMAEPGGTVDQQVPDAMGANVTHGHRRPLVLLPSSFGRWVVVGIAGTHTPYLGRERLQNKSHGYHTGPKRHFAFRSRHETSRNVSLGCGKPNKNGLFSVSKKCDRLRGESRPREPVLQPGQNIDFAPPARSERGRRMRAGHTPDEAYGDAPAKLSA